MRLCKDTVKLLHLEFDQVNRDTGRFVPRQYNRQLALLSLRLQAVKFCCHGSNAGAIGSQPCLIPEYRITTVVPP